MHVVRSLTLIAVLFGSATAAQAERAAAKTPTTGYRLAVGFMRANVTQNAAFSAYFAAYFALSAAQTGSGA